MNITKPLFSQQELRFFEDLQRETETRVSKPPFLMGLVQVFGGRYVKHIAVQLDDTGRQLLKVVQDAFNEIQEQFGNLRQASPCTDRLLAYFSLTQGREQLRKGFQKQSLDLVPFLLFREGFPGLDQVRRVRSVGLRALNQTLSKPETELKAEEKLAILKLLFGAGAFHEEKTVYFIELLYQWTSPAEIEKLMQRLGINHWVPRIEAVGKRERGGARNFQEFVIACTIDLIAKTFEVEINISLQETLEEVLTSESLRSDIACMLAHPEVMRKKDWTNSSYLLSFQICTYLLDKYELRPRDRADLLEICLSRTPNSGVPSGFEKKEPQETKQKLEIALQVTLSMIHEAGDPHTYPLLLFFLDQSIERGEHFGGLFSELRKIPAINMQPAMIEKFCRANEAVAIHVFKDFAVTYKQVVELCRARGEVSGTEALFLHPPIVLNERMLKLGEASNQASRFLTLVQQYGFPMKDSFFRMLREFVFKPSAQVFDLVKTDAPAFGIQRVDEPFLTSIFADGAQLERALLSTDKPGPKGLVQSLCRIYPFSDAERFSLYLEALRQGSDVPFRQISQFVSELTERLGLVLSPKELYFLYRHHPIPFAVDALVAMREDLMAHNIQKFQINQKELSGVLGAIRSVWQELFSTSVSDDKEMMAATCEKLMHSVFLPPLQPLTDFFRISGVNEEGVRLNSEHLESHLGEIKMIPGTSFGTHIEWHLNNRNFPTISIAFFNPRTGVVESALRSLRIPQDPGESRSQDARAQIFGTLFETSQQLLQSEEDVDEFNIAISEDLGLGFRAEINNFVQGVKIAYREAHWSMITGKPHIPKAEMPNPQIAALGNISARGALIPDAFLRLEPTPNFYTADFESEPKTLDLCRKLFQKGSGAQEHLQVKMLFTRNGQIGEGGDLYARTEIKGTDSYVTLLVGYGDRPLQVALRYPKEVLEDERLFAAWYRFHILRLKARCYQEFSVPVLASP